MAPCSGLIHLRRATLDDCRGIAEVHVRTWQAAYRGQLPHEFLDGLSIARREAWWRDELNVTPAERLPWIAESDAGIAGFVSVGQSRDADADARTGEVYAIYVDPDCWKRGIGRNLLTHATRDLKQAGYGKATLWVLASNDRARTFYEAARWRVDGGTQMIELGGSSLEEVRYRREL